MKIVLHVEFVFLLGIYLGLNLCHSYQLKFLYFYLAGPLLCMDMLVDEGLRLNLHLLAHITEEETQKAALEKTA